ncbi:MAG: hypothetical protein RL172_2365 [Bacteroidota bacterium]
MKIMITGANGLVGQHLLQTLTSEGKHSVIATGRGPCRLSIAASQSFVYDELDITDAMAVHQCIYKYKPELIIHATAMTQPDPCELDKVACWLVNVTATRFLIDAAMAVQARFLFLSTDFVFDGLNGPYHENDETGPVNYYGSSKLAAENAVMHSGLHWAIVRTVLVYGDILAGTRSNIVSWVKQNLTAGKPIKVVNDQVRTPNYVQDLVNGLLLVAEKNATGIFHISGQEVLTPYDMALAVANYMQLDKNLMTQVNASTFTQPAQRPLKTGFVIDKAKSQLGFRPISFKQGLQKMLG